MPPELNLLVGDLAGLGLTAVGEAASGDVGDLSGTASLLEFSVAPSAPSRFKGTHFWRPPSIYKSVNNINKNGISNLQSCKICKF